MAKERDTKTLSLNSMDNLVLKSLATYQFTKFNSGLKGNAFINRKNNI